MLRRLKRSDLSSGGLFLFALFLLPLLINPVVSLNFNDVFLNVKVIWTLVIILPSAAYLIWNNFRPLDSLTVKLVGGWLGWLILAGLLSGRGWLLATGAPNRLQGLPIYLTYALTALASYCWSRNVPQAGEQLLKALSWLMVPLGIYVILQYYGVAGVISANAFNGVEATVAGATLGNRGYLAGCIAMLLPLAAAFASRSRVGLLCMFFAGFSLTASQTRGAILAAVIAYVLWMLQGNARKYLLHTALLLGLLLPLIPLTTDQASLRGFGSGTGEQELTDGSGRAPLWHTAVYGIELRPLFGWGPGQLLDVMAARSDSALLRELKILPSNRTFLRLPRSKGTLLAWRSVDANKAKRISQTVNAVHNEYLEYAFTYGVPAALLFLTLFLVGIMRAWKRVPWAVASLAAYLTYLLTWPETVRFAPLAWAVLGIALASSQSIKLNQPLAKPSSKS